MSPIKAKAIPIAIASSFLILVGLAQADQAEIVQRGNLRVSFEAELAPKFLPREGTAPIRISLGGRIGTTDGKNPPQLRRIEIEINRHGRINPKGLPVCKIDDIQPSTTQGALAACGRSLVGTGGFSAEVLLPQQAPFPSSGRLHAFNGTYEGKPAILAHVFGTDPAPISYTLPFEIREKRRGAFGTTIVADLPSFTSGWGYVTGLELRLGRRYTHRGKSRSYVSAGCPAPKGFSGAVFRFAKATYGFAGGRTISSTLRRNCRVRG